MMNHYKRTTFRYICLATCLLATAEAIGQSAGSPDFHVFLDAKGHYKVTVDKEIWLKSSPTFFTVGNKLYSSADDSLKLLDSSTDYGYDQLGPWNSSSLYYRPVGTKVKVKVMLRWYRELPLVLFGQHYITSASGCSTNDRNSVSSGFPSFFIEGAASAKRDRELAYLAYGGIMAGDTSKRIGVWSSELFRAESGLDSGPLVVFDKSGHALMISPFSQFMATSVQYTACSTNMSQHPGTSHDKQRTASWGIMGNVIEVPQGYEMWTALMYSPDGINKLMSQWGYVMRYYYKKPKSYRDSDLANNYLGYWTANGAYYYYTTEPGMNYQDTILAVKQYANTEKIPYRYVEYDSWWYPKGVDKGVTEWTSLPAVFPQGLRYMWDKTGWPVVAHNRWWSNYTSYAKQNGGHYNFIVENNTAKALPTDQPFWDDLLGHAKRWGLISYEQDWLNVQFDEMSATVASLTLGDQWLHQMADASQKAGVTVQYCMSPSRHTLASLQLPVVNQIRVTTDYQPGEDINWRIGVTDMFAAAVGLAPFKDLFWTTSHQPGNPYNSSEPFTELNSVAATLSTGPVATGDRVGYSDKNLIMRSCNEDGLILKPSKPVTAINKQLILAAYNGFKGEVWSTFSYISRLQFGIIIGAAFNDTVTVGPTEAGFRSQRLDLRGFSRTHPNMMLKFSDSLPIKLRNCTRKQFCLWYTTPLLHIGSQQVAILGELSKWVVMSPQRVTSITVQSDDLQMTLAGVTGEKTAITFQVDGIMTTVRCVISQSGGAVLSLKKHQCVGL